MLKMATVREVEEVHRELKRVLDRFGAAETNHERFDASCLTACKHLVEVIGRINEGSDDRSPEFVAPRRDVELISSGLLAALLRFAGAVTLNYDAQGSGVQKLREALRRVEELEAAIGGRG